jgi:hypothetical protein
MEVWRNTISASLCNWHVHIEPVLYARMGTEGEWFGAEDSYQADCESGVLAYDGMDNVPAQEYTVGDPEDVDATEH